MFEYPPPGTDILQKQVFDIRTDNDFDHTALAVFRYQYRYCPVYRQFADLIGCDPEKVTKYTDIPFLPVGLFKSKRVTTFDVPPELIFKSSGTTGQIQSRHFVFDQTIYQKSILNGFRHFYGDIRNTIILGLVPDVNARPDSSLAYMTSLLIRESGDHESGIFLGKEYALQQKINRLKDHSKKIILIGLSYALLDMAEKYPLTAPGLIVVETGGMKGRREELIREKLHQHLCAGFGVEKIHSEYSMSELLSQAWSGGDGIFQCPPWMKVLARDAGDPLTLLPAGSRGGINIIDLACIHSCSFLAVQDMGIVHQGGAFEISGRFDNSDLRGCSLLLA